MEALADFEKALEMDPASEKQLVALISQSRAKYEEVGGLRSDGSAAAAKPAGKFTRMVIEEDDDEDGDEDEDGVVGGSGSGASAEW